MEAVIRRLQRMCRRWGGELLQPDRTAFATLSKDDGWAFAPFGFGYAVNYDRRLVSAVKDVTLVGNIIHEMGHVFAAEAAPAQLPSEQVFMGWEYAVARKVGCVWAWFESSYDYFVEYRDPLGRELSTEFGMITTAERRWLLPNLLADVRAAELIDADNVPLTCR